MNNIYEDPDYANVRIDMHEKLEELRDKYGDSEELQEKYLEKYLEHRNRGEDKPNE